MHAARKNARRRRRNQVRAGDVTSEELTSQTGPAHDCYGVALQRRGGERARLRGWNNCLSGDGPDSVGEDASHEVRRKDFENSTTKLDLLVSIAQHSRRSCARV